MAWMVGLQMICLAIFWKKCTRTEAATRRLILTLLTGWLLAVSFPMSYLTFLVFIAWVPLLFVAEDDISFWTLVGHAFFAFWIWNVFTTFWVLNTSFIPGIVANTLNAFLMTLPWMLYYYVRRHLGRVQSLVGLVAFWITFEYIHLYWEISWPWLNLGHYFATFPDMVQWYEFTGAFGGSLWIWLVNGALFLILVGGRKELKYKTVAWALLLAPLAISFLVGALTSIEGEKAEVVIVQPNYEPHYEKFTVTQREQLERMISLANDKITDTTAYVIFPETVIRNVHINRINAHTGVAAFARLTQLHPNLAVVTGASTYRTLTENEKDDPATRLHISSRGDSTYWDLQNASLWIEDGEVKEDYFKSKLVPGAEIFPYHEFLPFLKPVIDALGGTKAGHFIQEEREVFGDDSFEVAPAICYESIYGEYVGDYVKEGAKAIFIMTNDGWWDDTPGHEQHLAFARLRAIEHRRDIARAANTGISAFIDQKGRVHQPTGYEEAASIRGQLCFNDKMTFYTQYGDIIADLAVLLSALFIALLIRVRLIPKV
jgi:apolipoprotein N-acyltransferase